MTSFREIMDEVKALLRQAEDKAFDAFDRLPLNHPARLLQQFSKT